MAERVRNALCVLECYSYRSVITVQRWFCEKDSQPPPNDNNMRRWYWILQQKECMAWKGLQFMLSVGLGKFTYNIYKACKQHFDFPFTFSITLIDKSFSIKKLKPFVIDILILNHPALHGTNSLPLFTAAHQDSHTLCDVWHVLQTTLRRLQYCLTAAWQPSSTFGTSLRYKWCHSWKGFPHTFSTE